MHVFRSGTHPDELQATWSPLKEVYIKLLSVYIRIMEVNWGM